MSNLSASAQKGKQTLKDFQKIFNPEIEKYLEYMQTKIHGEFDMEVTKKAFDVFVDYSTREAKRLRASFVYYVHKMYNGKQEKGALQAGIVIELEHAHLLMVDDFMDRSKSRRGGPSAHLEFEKYYREANYSGANIEHFGNSISVNASLIGAYLGQHLLAEMEATADTRLRFLENLNRNLVITGIGQITDVTNAYRPSVSEEDVMKMLKWKTGVYTYENPIHTGAILAEAPDEELEKLAEFAIPGGISFQIQDDILGMFGDAKEMGKSAMDDLAEGKYTLLIHKALEKANEKQLQIIRRNLGRANITEQDHEDVKKVIVDTGALEYTRNKALELVKQAKDSLARNKDESWNMEGFDYLNNIADYVIERKK